jgi:hypothetical protein
MRSSRLPPIIIIGAHRSGTGMISRMLEKLGLFTGKKKDPNHEAFFFLKVNDWLLHQSGGAWDNPDSIRLLLNNARVRALAADYICYMMKTHRVASYLGWGKYLRYHSPTNLDIPWGWKDPRNTFTLPLWLDIFPEAKVVHTYRHGVDVANSLRVRVHKQLMGAESLHNKRKQLHLYWFRSKSGGFAHTLRCASLEGSFSLWEAYLKNAQAHVQRLGHGAMEIKYEDFLAEPRQGLTSLAHFCGLSATDTAIASVAKTVKKDRAYAYRGDPALQVFAEKVSTQLARRGY